LLGCDVMDKNKKEDVARQKKDAEAIIAQIKKESEREVERIIADARTAAGKIIDEGAAESERRRSSLLLGMRQETEKARERVFSGLALEKKRLLLEEKGQFIGQVIEEVYALARRFRDNKQGYNDFLRMAAAEGVRVVGSAELELSYARPDEQIFSSADFRRSLEASCAASSGKKTAFSYMKGDFDEIGIVISSPGGAIRFDNRFSSRLARLQADIYAQLLKDSF